MFSAASAACGLAPSLGVLIALRVVQAGGAALLQANSVALVVTSVPARTRRAALGVQAAAQAVGLACGPVVGGVLVGTVGWRWVFFINVPVGLLAVAAGWYLLPRTQAGGRAGGLLRLRAGPERAGLAGAKPSPAPTWPGWACWRSRRRPACPRFPRCPGSACRRGRAATWRRRRRRRGGGGGGRRGGAALVRHFWRAAAPLLYLRALAAAGTGPALGGALCAYLLPSGPLVLFPQVVSARGGSAASAGLRLTALLPGFGLAAAAVDRLIPAGWPNRRRCVVGGALAAASAAALAVPAPDPVSVALLGLLGVGLGIYTPANNAEIMASVPARDAAAAGGMVNMTRGIGTALGVAVVSLGLHVGTFLRQPDAGLTLSMAALAAVALVGVWCGQRGGRADLTPAGDPARAQPAGGRPAVTGGGSRGPAGDTAPPPTAWPRGSPGSAARCAAAPASPTPATPSRSPSSSCWRRWPNIPGRVRDSSPGC